MKLLRVIVLSILGISSLTLNAKPIFKSDVFFEHLIRNFKVVEKKRCYRFGQLSPAILDNYIREHNLKLIINLRGSNRNMDWYRKEHDVAKKRGAVVIDTSMSADHFPSKHSFFLLMTSIYNPRALIEKPSLSNASLEELKKSILSPTASTNDLFGKPIAVAYHCMVGADRTGLAIAIRDFENAMRNHKQPITERIKKRYLNHALQHLTIKHRHFRTLHPKMAQLVRRWAEIRSKYSLAEALDRYPF